MCVWSFIYVYPEYLHVYVLCSCEVDGVAQSSISTKLYSPKQQTCKSVMNYFYSVIYEYTSINL